MPPMPGPITVPVCHAMELKAMARGRMDGGTILGTIDDMDGPTKTRATPCIAAIR